MTATALETAPCESGQSCQSRQSCKSCPAVTGGVAGCAEPQTNRMGEFSRTAAAHSATHNQRERDREPRKSEQNETAQRQPDPHPHLHGSQEAEQKAKYHERRSGPDACR